MKFKHLGKIKNAKEGIALECGEVVKVYLRMEGGIIKEAKYMADSLFVKAWAERILEKIEGKRVDEIKEVEEEIKREVEKETPRRKVLALLPLEGIKRALKI